MEPPARDKGRPEAPAVGEETPAVGNAASTAQPKPPAITAAYLGLAWPRSPATPPRTALLCAPSTSVERRPNGPHPVGDLVWRVAVQRRPHQSRAHDNPVRVL